MKLPPKQEVPEEKYPRVKYSKWWFVPVDQLPPPPRGMGRPPLTEAERKAHKREWNQAYNQRRLFMSMGVRRQDYERLVQLSSAYGGSLVDTFAAATRALERNPETLPSESGTKLAKPPDVKP